MYGSFCLEKEVGHWKKTQPFEIPFLFIKQGELQGRRWNSPPPTKTEESLVSVWKKKNWSVVPAVWTVSYDIVFTKQCVYYAPCASGKISIMFRCTVMVLVYVTVTATWWLSVNYIYNLLGLFSFCDTGFNCYGKLDRLEKSPLPPRQNNTEHVCLLYSVLLSGTIRYFRFKVFLDFPGDSQSCEGWTFVQCTKMCPEAEYLTAVPFWGHCQVFLCISDLSSLLLS